jgi:hypothetical protein
MLKIPQTPEAIENFSTKKKTFLHSSTEMLRLFQWKRAACVAQWLERLAQ